MTSARFDLGALTLPYRAQSLDRALRGIAEAGFSVVGLFTDHEGGPLLPAGADADRARKVRRQVEEYDLAPVMLFSRQGAFESTDALVTELDLCAAMEVPYLQGLGRWPFAGGGCRKPEMAWYEEVEHYLTVLEEGAREAERRGVTIVLKPHRGVTATGGDLVTLLGRIGSPAVRASWDAGNVRFYEGLNSEDDLESSGVAPLVSTVCIKDHAGSQGDPTFPVPGDGDVDHTRVLKTLAAVGFRGPLLVERVDQSTPEDTDAALARARAFLESAARGASTA